MKFRFIKSSFVLCAALAVLFSCVSESESTPEPKTKIYLNTTSIKAPFNSTASLFVFVKNDTSKDGVIKWSTSNEAVASLSAVTGDSIEVLTGSSEGTARITVKAGDNSRIVLVEVKEIESPVTKEIWKASDYNAPSSTGDTLGIMTAVIGSKGITSASGGLKFEGGGSTSGPALKFTMTRSAKITIKRDSQSDRTLALYNGTAGKEVAASTSSSFSYEYTNSGTPEDFYIYSKGSGITIYSVTFEYNDEAQSFEITYPSAVTLDETELNFDEDNIYATLNPVLENAASVTEGYDGISWLSSEPSVAAVNDSGLVQAKKDGTAVIYATTVNGLVASCNVTVDGYTNTIIRPDDVPTGYAGEGWTSFYDSSKVITVNNKSDLINYAKKGGYTIYVDGMIDLSDGMLPSGTSGNSTSKLDEFVKNENTGYSTYKAYNSGKLSGISADADWTNTLNQKYRNNVVFSLASKTAIIGLDSSAGIKGGGISISSSYVVIRNLLIQDGYDPFPNHEKNDGWNAQIDAIAVGGGSHVWIDHCTLEDTVSLGFAPNNEKFQTYDGLCDITKCSKYVTVSNCILRNHDKTMLIGSSKTDTGGGCITLSDNRFYRCGQRLPLTCLANMHIYNNYYGDQSGFYSNSYAIGARYSVYTIIAEGNYFGKYISDAFKASTSPSGTCYARGNSSNSGSLSTTSSKPFSVPYEYELLSYNEAKTYVTENAGAGVWTVKQ